MGMVPRPPPGLWGPMLWLFGAVAKSELGQAFWKGLASLAGCRGPLEPQGASQELEGSQAMLAMSCMGGETPPPPHLELRECRNALCTQSLKLFDHACQGCQGTSRSLNRMSCT